MSDREKYRQQSSVEVRTSSPQHHIDPGFVNRRKIFSVFGERFVQFFEQHRAHGDDHFSTLRNDHLMVNMALQICEHTGVKSLSQVLIEGPKVGMLVSSTETLEGDPGVWENNRASNRIVSPFESDLVVTLEYSTEHIFSTTTKGELQKGTTNSILGEVKHVSKSGVVIHPLVIGAPSFDHPANQEQMDQLFWAGWDQYEVFPEDLTEFAKLKTVEVEKPEEWMAVMKSLSENAVKEKIAEILGDITKKDWGGEQNDHYTSGITMGASRTTAAFLLKGPAKFEEMQPRHLGKNADQIYRLAACPAKLLIVQHCHDIGEAVRATLRAFAVTPHAPRHYCLIDGKDTYKLLKAYGKI